MKNYVIYGLILCLFSVVGCKSSKEVQKSGDGEVLIETYCSGEDFQSDNKYVRASSLGESLDQVMSKRKARTNTLEELSSKIETTVKTVIDNYYNSTSTNQGEQLSLRYEGMTREVTNRKISGYKTICEKVTRTKSGTYKTYLCFELAVDDILNPIYDSINDDEKLRIDYDYEKFKQTFEEEMKKQERY